MSFSYKHLSFLALFLGSILLFSSCSGDKAQEKADEANQPSKPEAQLKQQKSTPPPSQEVAVEDFETFFAQHFIGKSTNGILNGISGAIHEEIGVYLAYRPGAGAVIGKYSTIEQLKESMPNLGDILQDMNCTLEKGTLPKLDETGSFDKAGCFAEKVEGRTPISDHYNEIAEVMMLSFEEAELTAAKAADGQINHIVLMTEAGAALGFGQIEGAWKLIFIDLASYDLGV